MLRSAFIASFLATTLTACGFVAGWVEDSIESEIIDRIDSGGGGDDDGGDGPDPIDEDAITINSLQPNRGLTEGGLTIDIIGLNLPEQALVTLGESNLACTDVVFVSEARLRCTTPASPAGLVGVRVVDVSDTQRIGTLPSAFEYFDRVKALSSSPARGPSAGGTLISIEGDGFVRGTEVRFGPDVRVDATVVDKAHLVVRSPELPRGTYDLRVANINGNATLAAAFSTFDPVRIDAVVPFAGPTSGATAIEVQGSGFVPGTALSLGTSNAAATPDTTEMLLSANTPAGSAEGPVDVSVGNLNGEALLKDGFVYIDGTNADPRVVDISPNRGVIEGGTEVRIAGVGFASGDVTVYFDTSIATCNGVGDSMLTCTAPPHPEGLVDVRVTTTGGMDVTVDKGFRYFELRLDSVEPARGAIAGGTYVHLLGAGFDEETRVFFDTREAEIDEIFAGGTEMTLRTPRHAVGLASVYVRAYGSEAAIAGGFEYFDPGLAPTHTSGGPIEGSVNVTVLDERGRAIEDAFVVVGTNQGAEHLAGYTNVNGQITLSGPSVYGPQTVHAIKLGYQRERDVVNLGNFTWVDVDAQNLLMTLSLPPEPPPSPLPECPDGANPALVRGQIYRIKDEYNTGTDTVTVTTSLAYFGQQLPDPGPNAQLISQGPYEAYVRSGELVLLALAGDVVFGQLSVKAMGFRPFVNTEPSSGRACAEVADCDLDEQCVKEPADAPAGTCWRVYEGMDIVIDTPVDRDMRVEFVEPPFVEGTVADWAPPTNASAFVWYDFGSMGLHIMGSSGAWFDGSDWATSIRMPRAMPQHMENIGYFNVQGEVTGYGIFGDQTWSVTGQSGLQDTNQTIVLDPFLRGLRELSPIVWGEVDSRPLAFELEQLPDNDVVGPSGIIHYMYRVENIDQCVHPIFGVISQPEVVIEWMAITPGDNMSFALPYFTGALSAANLSPSLHYWQLTGMYSPGVEFNNLNINELYDWKSQSGRALFFSVAP